MPFTLSASEVRQAMADNARKPAEERWSMLITRYGRYARKRKLNGVEASTLRDEKPRRAEDFGSEKMRAKRHGAKGSTKTLPGKGPSRDFTTAYRDDMIKQGVIKPVVIKKVVVNPVIAGAAAETIKRMLSGAGK